MKLERNSAGAWFLIDVKRDEIYPATGEVFRLVISGAAASDITKRAFAGYAQHAA